MYSEMHAAHVCVRIAQANIIETTTTQPLFTMATERERAKAAAAKKEAYWVSLGAVRTVYCTHTHTLLLLATTRVAALLLCATCASKPPSLRDPGPIKDPITALILQGNDLLAPGSILI